MKIDVDLSGIFEDEDGNILTTDFAKRIEDAIVARADSRVRKLVIEKFEKEISIQITGVVNDVLHEVMVDLLDKEFIPTGMYGDREKATTLRNQICKNVERMMVWKEPSSYSSDQSAYTKVVKEVVAAQLKEFAKEFNKTVDTQLVAECMKYAVNKISKTTGEK